MNIILIKNRNFLFILYWILFLLLLTIICGTEARRERNAAKEEEEEAEIEDSLSLFPELEFGSLLMTDNNYQCKKDRDLLREHFSNFSLWAHKSKCFSFFGFIVYVIVQSVSCQLH